MIKTRFYGVEVYKIELNFMELESYNFPINEVIWLKVNYDDVIYDFIIRFTDLSNNLLCFGSGASERNQKASNGTLIKPPLLKRWSWYKYFDDSVITYADPIFYEDNSIKIGWYVGNKNQWYLEIISKIIVKLCSNNGINSNNILFYGSSGGGFSSIILGTLIKNSKVLVNNSQFFIKNFDKVHVDNLFSYLRQSFNGLSDNQIYDKIKHRLDVVELFKKENYMPFISYYVNQNSIIADVNNQCIPFINEIKQLSCFNKLDIHFYVDDNGHNPMGLNESISIIKNFSKKYLGNDFKICFSSSELVLPFQFKLISNNEVFINNTSITLNEIYDKSLPIFHYVEEYIAMKKRSKVDVEYNKIIFNECIIYKTKSDNSKFVHYWFEKNDSLYHFYTWSAADDIDDIFFKLFDNM